MSNPEKSIATPIAQSLIVNPGEFVQRGANGALVAVPSGSVGQVPKYQTDGSLAPGDSGGAVGAGQVARCDLATPTAGGSANTLSWGDGSVASVSFDTFEFNNADGSGTESLSWLTASGTTLAITAAGTYLIYAFLANSSTYSASMKAVHFSIAGDQSGIPSDNFISVGSTSALTIAASIPANIVSATTPSPLGLSVTGVGTNFGVTNYSPTLVVVKVA